MLINQISLRFPQKTLLQAAGSKAHPGQTAMATEANMSKLDQRPFSREQASETHAIQPSVGRHPVIALLRSAVFGNDKVRYRMATFLGDTLKSALSVTCKRISRYSMEDESAPPSSAARNVFAHDDTCIVILHCLDAKSLLQFSATCAYNG